MANKYSIDIDVNVIYPPKMDVLIKRLSDTATLPTYGSEKAACFDVSADFRGRDSITMPPHSTVKIGIGWAFQPPIGCMLQILQRSGLASKGIFPVGGIVDEDYRGEVLVALHNSTNNDFIVKHGDRIAQIALRRYSQANFTEVTDLDNTSRGSNGFGSTGL